MDLTVVAAAVATGMAGFYGILWLTNTFLTPRALIRARTTGGGPREEVIAPLRLRRRLNTKLLFSGEGTELKLIRSGWAIRVIEYRFLRLLCAVMGGALALFLIDVLSIESRVLGLLFVIGLAALGSMLPVFYVDFRRDRRVKQIDNQLPIALTSMSKSLLAGTGLLQALDYAAEQTSAPLGPELVRTISDLRLGGDASIVFEELNRRVGSTDLEIVTTAIMIQRTVGGNLSEILANAAGTIRERHELRREVSVLTTRHRVTADIVAILPVGLFFAFFLVNPDVAKLLFTETVGKIALAFAISMELLGLWVMQRLARIEV